MYPRLELLWQLLTPDGVILISINDDEGHYLKVLCDEIFGRKNFIANLVWNTEGNTDNQAKIINYHEYIFVYARAGQVPFLGVLDPNIDEDSKLNLSTIRNTVVKNGPKNPVSDIFLPPGFPCTFANGVIPPRQDGWPRLSNEVLVQDSETTIGVTVSSGWSSKNILERFIATEYSPVIDSKNQVTRFEMTPNGTIEAVKDRTDSKGHFISVLRNFGTTNQSSKALKRLGLTFTFPKPVGLISYLIEAFADQNAVVLDSFAGSGTTGEALHRMNSADSGQRKFILIEESEQSASLVIRPRLATGGADFRFYRLGHAIFDENGRIDERIKFPQLAAHVWFTETRTPRKMRRGEARSPFLGEHDGTAYYLLYNGILGDRTSQGGNVLTRAILAALPPHNGPRVIYGESCRLSDATLKHLDIAFKQTPYDVRAR